MFRCEDASGYRSRSQTANQQPLTTCHLATNPCPNCVQPKSAVLPANPRRWGLMTMRRPSRSSRCMTRGPSTSCAARCGSIHSWFGASGPPISRSFLGRDKALACLPGVRGDFAQRVRFHALELEGRYDSEIDGSTKLLFRTASGYTIETVILRVDSGRTSVCISSQVGCASNCLFCATGKMGVAVNLTGRRDPRPVGADR